MESFISLSGIFKVALTASYKCIIFQIPVFIIIISLKAYYTNYRNIK